MSEEFDPSAPGLAHQKMSPRWKIMRDVVGGTETMRAAGETYLPKDKNETQTNYDRRLTSTFLLNKTADAIQSSVAKPFSKEVHITEETDADLVALAEDIDLRGNNLTVFAQTLMEEAMTAGLVHIVVDYPTVDPEQVKNLAQEREIAARPYFAMVKAEDLLYAAVQRVNGRPVIVEARYLERVSETSADGSEVEIEQVRQWTPGLQTVWRANEDGEWYQAATIVMSMPHVALLTLYAGRREKDFVVKPLFLDLAYKNIEHWQSSSEQRAILRYSRFPIPYVTGIDPTTATDPETGAETLTFGPDQMWVIPEANGKVGYLEPNGSSIQLGFTDLDKIERQMSELSMKPHIPDRTGTVTATFHALEAVTNHSAVQKVAMNLSDLLEQGFMFAAAWLNKAKAEVGVAVNTDFSPLASDNDEFELVKQMRDSGDLSRKTMWEEARRRDILSPNFNPDDEKVRLLTENELFGDTGNQTGDESTIPDATLDQTEPVET